MKKINRTLNSVLIIFVFIIYGLFSYLREYINLDYAGFLYTFAGEKGGTGLSVFTSVAKHLVPFLISAFIVLIVYRLIVNSKNVDTNLAVRIFRKTINFNFVRFFNRLVSLFLVLLIVLALISVDQTYAISAYYRNKSDETYIYDDYYVNPNDVAIEGENTKNLILIYVESLETSFSSKENGGFLDYELLPNSRKLTEEGVNFSFDENVGGFNSITGTTWTMGALFGSESGIPFLFPIDGNDMGKDSEFAEKVTTMGDVLESKGYNQEFLCGSDAKFAGRKSFFLTHGDYKIYDYNSALEDGYVNDYVWWGFDDEDLYKIAKDELQRLSSEEKPFCLTMLTADTHHVGGYFCDLCKNEHDIQYANVVACADRQLYSFVQWIKEQEFYKDTVIVIMGDHPTMDSTLINSDLSKTNNVDKRNVSILSIANRYVYNCFINSSKESTNNKNRQFNTLDMFPTILSSMGFSIEGDRLGLGTDLFSDRSTLQEELGLELMNGEFAKYSNYYVENFY